VLWLTLASPGTAAPPFAGHKGERLTPYGVPPPVQSVLQGLGDRLRKPGKERVVVDGTLTDASGDAQVTLVRELPNRLRLDGTGTNARHIMFDGNRSAGRSGELSNGDLAIIESLAPDTQESFLYSVAHGAACLLLGRRVGTADGSGPYDDVFELSAAESDQNKSLAGPKLYFFDSTTKLLRVVRYRRQTISGDSLVETKFSNWTMVGGQLVPSTIQRTENGAEVFSFRSRSTALTPTVADGAFSAP